MNLTDDDFVKICEDATKSFNRSKIGYRGQQVDFRDSYDYHLIISTSKHLFKKENDLRDVIREVQNICIESLDNVGEICMNTEDSAKVLTMLNVKKES